MKSKTLIIGATGKTGMPVVEQALASGQDVRAVIRREDERSSRLRSLGAETVIGDVHNIQSVRAFMTGVSKLYFSYPTHLTGLVEATANIATAAKDEGVKAIVNMSQISVRENARSKLTHQHWLSEKILDWSGVGAIHIRPNYFMENMLLFNAQ
ncbi:MAG: NAD(P)H-binding protein [Opitutaceae bacterium]|nr:NAD(P)H-binding protein [Opitutaceae bacterium]